MGTVVKSLWVAASAVTIGALSERALAPEATSPWSRKFLGHLSNFMHTDDVLSHARQIQSTSIIFDTHADTPQRFLFDQFDLAHRDAEGSVDIPRMREGGVGAIFFALWVPVDITGSKATRRAIDLLDATLEQIRNHADDLTLATCSDEVRAARAQGKIAVLMGAEGGHAIDNNLDVLRDFFA